jgi:hypothetical protein
VLSIVWEWAGFKGMHLLLLVIPHFQTLFSIWGLSSTVKVRW